MNDPIDDLVQRWKQNPSASTTVALCDALCDSPRVSLVAQVGAVAARRHAGDVTVLVSVARMYIEANRLAEAQAVLVAAGKQATTDPRVYRWLGEVLLRRGDATRAEKVLDRAVLLGPPDAATRLWLERARGLRPLQSTEGETAVATEVAHISFENGRPPSLSDVDTRVFLTPDHASLPEPKRRNPPPPPAARTHAMNQAMPASNGAVHIRPSHGRAAPEPAATPEAARREPWVPHPRDVLDALALAGVFESHAAPAPSPVWDRAQPKPKGRGPQAILASLALFLVAGVGVYQFYKHKRAEEHVLAEALLTKIEAQLHGGRPDTLPSIEKDLARAFQLESRSPRAALDWTRERALVGLVKGGADVAFEDAMARAKDVGVPEERYAFAQVASFLLQGDTAGAAAVLPRWDGPASGDAWYQLVAGATLERAGDGRARGRYLTASQLDADLLVARVGLARATAFDGDADEAMRLAKALRARVPDRAEPVALVALAWGRDPMREPSPVPPEVDTVATYVDALPSGLKFVPYAVTAIRAIDRRAIDEARAAVQKGLAACESPGCAVWLGSIALPLGDEVFARKAAVAALQFSAVYEPARALAARVALNAGRLDEALKATEELDPSPDVTVVRAAAAYERVDPDGVARALDSLPADARKLPSLSALAMAGGTLSGRLTLEPAKLKAMADDGAPWSDIVAMDAALNVGDLVSANKISATWGKESESKPVRALRLARLARYEGRLDAADGYSQTALDHGTVTARVLWERVFVLVARGRAVEVTALLARYPLALGPLATWLSAYASAASGAIETAKGKTASLDAPPESSPLETRVIAAAAFGAMKDKRRGIDYVKKVLATGNLHPDLVAAALSLGLRRVDHGSRRRPTFE